MSEHIYLPSFDIECPVSLAEILTSASSTSQKLSFLHRRALFCYL